MRRFLYAALSLLASGGIAFAVVYYSLLSKPRFGLLTVRSEPPGAEVFVDAQKIGVTPLEDRQVPAGNRRVRLTKDGYFDVERSVIIRSHIETPLKETLEPIIHVQLTREAVRKVEEFIRKAQLTLKEEIHFPPPEDYNTVYFCRQILQLDTSNQFARDTLRQLASDLRQQANQAYASGNLQEAEQLLAELAKIEPKDAETASRLEEVRQKVQQSQEERQSKIALLQQRIEEAFPEDRLAPPHANNALEMLRELSQLDTRNRYARGARLKLRDQLRDRAEKLAGQQDWSGAKNAFTYALQISPEDTDLSDRLVAVNKKIDELAQAELEKQRRAEQERQRTTRGQELRRSGIASYRAGNYERALDELRQAADIQGIDDEISFYMGASYQELKQPERALTAFRDCIAANPNHAPALINLGLIYLNYRRDYARAEDHLLRAQQLGGAAGYDRNRLAQMIRDVRYQARLAKAATTPFLVEHHHAFGSCKGELLLNTAHIEYRGSDPDHNFVRAYNELRNLDYKSDGIDLRFGDKKYSFKFRNREDIQLVRELLSRREKE